MFLGVSRKTNIWGELGRAWQERGECFWRVVDTPVNTIKDEFLCEVRWKEWHPICKFSLIKFAFSAGIMLPSTWENLSRCSKKINTCLQKKTTTCNGLQAKQTFSDNIHIFQFWMWFLRFLSYFISKSSSFFLKKKLNWLLLHCILYLWAQKVCFRFLQSYFKLEILISLTFLVSFLVDVLN